MSWRQADADVRQHLDACVQAGRQIALIAPPVFSPTTRSVLQEFGAKFPSSRVYVYDFLHDGPRHSAWKRCYGPVGIPGVMWDRAEVILALESDFLGTEGDTVESIRRFAGGRDVVAGNGCNRLYAVEGAMSLTGANADYRLRLRPDAQGDFVVALLHEIGVVRNAVPVEASILEARPGATLKFMSERHGVPADVLDRLVTDLLAKRGKAIIRAGNTLPEGVHVAVNYLNEILGNAELYDMQSVRTVPPPLTSEAELEALVSGMNKGEIGMVIHLGTNPVYHLPRSFGYADALRSVPMSVSLAEMEDETGALCTFVLPVNTMLESWGDHEVRADVYSLQQPVVAPLYETRQKEAVLLSWMGAESPASEDLYHEYLKTRWEKEVFPSLGLTADFSSFWNASLHDGVVPVNGVRPPRPAFNKAALALVPGVPEARGAFTLVLRGNHFIGDGAFANNGWLQEIPHPLSKIVWDNYAAVSPRTAGELGVGSSDLIEVSTPYGKQRLPVFVQPGQADGCISVELGYGRWNAGPIGTGVGTDATVMMPRTGLTGTRIVPNVRVTRTAGRHELVSTQEHHSLDDTFLKDLHLKREIIREGTLLQYGADPEFLHHHKPELFSISKEVQYSGVKWAMAIDLNKCVGCNACVSGCNVENNIPVVGKEQVQKGREMQWIRIDRYYAGTPDDPRLSHQPMLCQHCDQAPCENVCPVVATTHSPDGLNQMTYNRCIGTRYCANACPYKIRRFNWWTHRWNTVGARPQDRNPRALNPDVTVRTRGVMEKCTFCYQRVRDARHREKLNGIPVGQPGNVIKTACQQTCPADAITFGDLLDTTSPASQQRKDMRAYLALNGEHALKEYGLKTMPSVSYLAKVSLTAKPEHGHGGGHGEQHGSQGEQHGGQGEQKGGHEGQHGARRVKKAKKNG